MKYQKLKLLIRFFLESMTFAIKIALLLILPFLIHAKDEFEYHRWPTVQSVNALIKRYEGELR